MFFSKFSLTLSFILLAFHCFFLYVSYDSMDEETESEPLALMNLPAIVLGRNVRVSVIFGCQNSTNIWEEQGEYSPLEATINGLLVKVSLRFNGSKTLFIFWYDGAHTCDGA